MKRIRTALIYSCAVILMACALLSGGAIVSRAQARAADAGASDPDIGRFQMSCSTNKDDDIKCIVMDTTSGAIETTYRFEGDAQCQKNDSMNHLFWCD